MTVKIQYPNFIAEINGQQYPISSLTEKKDIWNPTKVTFSIKVTAPFIHPSDANISILRKYDDGIVHIFPVSVITISLSESDANLSEATIDAISPVSLQGNPRNGIYIPSGSRMSSASFLYERSLFLYR